MQIRADSAFLLVCNATIPHVLEKAHVSIHTPYLGRAGWWERIGRWTKLMWKAGKNVAVPSEVANLYMLVRNSMKSDQSMKECKYTLKSIIKIHHASLLDLGSYSLTFFGDWTTALALLQKRIFLCVCTHFKKSKLYLSLSQGSVLVAYFGTLSMHLLPRKVHIAVYF